jgi:hypothetical protein
MARFVFWVPCGLLVTNLYRSLKLTQERAFFHQDSQSVGRSLEAAETRHAKACVSPREENAASNVAVIVMDGKESNVSGEKIMAAKIWVGMRSSIALVAILSWFSVSPTRTAAQGTKSQGNKAVWQNSISVVGSTVWVDASAYWTPLLDLCSVISEKILNSNYGTAFPQGTVIDARGIYPGTGNTQIPCTGDPFSGLTSPPPSTTILLPSGEIDAGQMWTIPNNTRIIGDEMGTHILAVSGFADPYIIQMGGSNKSGADLCPTNGYCTSVGIEHVFLNGNTANEVFVGGIDNQNSQGGSYANDVSMTDVSQTGLKIEAPGGTNSGPYSNLAFNHDKNDQSSSPICIDVETQTQGIHGVTCRGNATTAKTSGDVGIKVNASNNTIEDIHIEAYWDGIEVGLSGTVSNVVVSNVTGTETGNISAPTKNTVHLCGGHSWNPSSFGTCGSNSTVTDITVLHAMNGSGAATTTVVDDVTGNAIVSCGIGNGCALPLSTAIYALGEPDGGSTNNPAYSKFVSSPATPNGNYNGSSYIPTWGVGTKVPAGMTPTCSPIGAIYSQTNATGKSVFVCTPVSGGQWATIP